MNVSMYHKSHSSPEINQVFTPPTERGFLAGVSLKGGHRRRIFHEHHSAEHGFAEGSIYVRNFADEYKADLEPFEFLLLEVPFASLRYAAEDAGLRGVSGLSCVPGVRDPVLHHLALALLPVLENADEADALFVDQVAAAFQTYLISRYGGGQVASGDGRRRVLSRAQEATAKELLGENLNGDLLVADVAEACGLARGYFIRAFRETTGLTPHQWLTARRVARARALLGDRALSLAEIAISCGFSDQSHFTRVFAKIVGRPPGAWRRERTAASSRAADDASGSLRGNGRPRGRRSPRASA